MIIDFGLSKTVDVIIAAKATATNFNCGTPAWTAPEVLLREPFTAKSDVSSYGIVIWEVLQGDCIINYWGRDK